MFDKVFEYLGDILYALLDIFDVVWSYTILSVSGHNVALGNIACAIAFTMFGIKNWKYAKIFIHNHAHNSSSEWINVNPNIGATYEKILSILAVVVYAIIALEILNIPLEAFAFISGALALGIGLGAQNLINNFMSSVTISLEKTVKIGDLISVNGITGIIKSIGNRCVVVSTTGGSTVSIPNSKILQESLLNLTHTSSIVQYKTELIFNKYRMITHKDVEESPESLMQLLQMRTPIEHNIEHTTYTIMTQLKNIPEIIDASVILSEISDWTYIYKLSYTINVHITNIYNLQHCIGLAVADAFGAENITLTHLPTTIPK